MRGYFAIGVDRISKPVNFGTMLRTAHAFGASFAFTVDALPAALEPHADTSKAPAHLPVYHWAGAAAMILPEACKLVGIELVDDAIDLPSFRHPPRCAYLFGPERGVLAPALLARCDHVVRIPTAFCINVAIAGAVVMYDRLRSGGSFAPRPERPGAPHADARPAHRFGASLSRHES